MSEAKESKVLEKGMYECEKLVGDFKGEKVVYHSSTAQTLSDKKIVKVLKRIDNYVPATMKK